MKLHSAISNIEKCESVSEARELIQEIAENYGFSSFTILDSGNAYQAAPFYLGTVGDWEAVYRSNAFVHIDPFVSKARRVNIPFDWASMPMPHVRTGPKPRVARLMEAASDFSLREGLVVPFHFKDQSGHSMSSLCVLFWTEEVRKFYRVVHDCGFELHLLLIYAMQKVHDLRDAQKRSRVAVRSGQDTTIIKLTDREREVLSWAGRGKTIWETAEILKIAELTAETHVRNAIRKLEASNKTHAVARSITMGLIDP
ncbi:MAG: LuxR family transcriptional regulator [Hyphomicrobiales bacterium]|nr:LuxR family transcriptional regulator [Hyphomicrobiales bacterium]